MKIYYGSPFFLMFYIINNKINIQNTFMVKYYELY